MNSARICAHVRGCGTQALSWKFHLSELFAWLEPQPDRLSMRDDGAMEAPRLTIKCSTLNGKLSGMNDGKWRIMTMLMTVDG